MYFKVKHVYTVYTCKYLYLKVNPLWLTLQHKGLMKVASGKCECAVGIVETPTVGPSVAPASYYLFINL